MAIFAGIGLRRRTHEIAIRMALGAQPQNILRLIVGQGGRMASFALTRLMLSMLVEVRRTIR